MRRTGDLAVALDVAVIVAASALVCTRAHDLATMRVAVPLLLAGRWLAWTALPLRERDTGAITEAALLAGAALLGGFNDWLSVDRFGVYDYLVPTDLGGVSRIPSWMLLLWGMLLRLPLTLARWRRLGLPRHPDTLFWGDRPVGGLGARLGLLAALILGTRQLVYRLHEHALWSWLPMALALGVLVVAFRPGARRLAFVAMVLVLGPAVEAVYIRVGGLHAYELGWLAGVPLWIALWWGVGVLAWEEVAGRLLAR